MLRRAVRANDPAFARAWDDAIDASADVLEKEMIRRAVDGVDEPVYQGGKLVGCVRKYSDTLLIFALKGARPGKFRDPNKAAAGEAVRSVADMFRIMNAREAAAKRALPAQPVITVEATKEPDAEPEPKRPGPLVTRRKRSDGEETPK